MPVLDFIAWVLLIVWAALLVGGFLFRKSPTAERLVPPWVHAASALSLLLLAWYGYLLTRAGTDSARYAFVVAAGLTFAIPGGLLLAGAASSIRTRIGFSASALGHLLFIAAFARFGTASGSQLWLLLCLWLAIGGLVCRAVLTQARDLESRLAAAAVAYLILLFTTTGLGTGLALTRSLFGPLAAGVVLLLLGELSLITLRLLRRRTPSIGNATRLLRWPGLALLALSIWSALQSST